MYWLVTSLPVMDDDDTTPSWRTWRKARSNRAAGIRKVRVPVAAPSVCDESTEPPFVFAIATTRAKRSPKLPSGIANETVLSRMIFVRSAPGEDPLCAPGDGAGAGGAATPAAPC